MLSTKGKCISKTILSQTLLLLYRWQCFFFKGKPNLGRRDWAEVGNFAGLKMRECLSEWSEHNSKAPLIVLNYITVETIMDNLPLYKCKIFKILSFLNTNMWKRFPLLHWIEALEDLVWTASSNCLASIYILYLLFLKSSVWNEKSVWKWLTLI